MTPTLGLVIPEVLPTVESVELAVSLESVGFTAAWCTEIDRDPFVRCAAILARTEKLRVGTAVAVWARSPVTMAMTAGELHELSGHRFTCGVGAGTAYRNENHLGIRFDRPVKRMSEYLQVMRGVWGAQSAPFSFEGEYFTVRDFRQPYFDSQPPVLLAAVGNGMLRLSARQADGVMLNPSASVSYVRTQVTAQLEAAAPRRELHRSICLRASVDPDRSTARHRARRGIVEYSQYPVHQAQYVSYGFGREVSHMNDAIARGDHAAAIAAVSEDMVDVLGLAGTPDEVRRALNEWTGVVDSVALISPTGDLALDEVRANCLAVIDAFAASPR